MGVLFGVFIEKLGLGLLWRAGLLIGFLGGFTTFSSFSLDTLTLIQSGALFAAFANIFASVVGGILATSLGLLVVRAIFII